MKKILLFAIVTFSFITIASAQQTVEKTVNKESITEEVKKCNPNCKKESCTKKAACKSKKCDADCKKECCANKKAENKAECKTKKCATNCKKSCCANKKTGNKAECKTKKCATDCKKPCCTNKGETSDNKGEETTYACPMKCEGDKTYSKEGSCPKCKMDLKSTKN